MTDEYTSSSTKEAEHEAQPVFAPYDAPAGGWGALHAVAKALREQSIVLKGSRSLLSMNQPDGFDCPGCAWPDPRHTSSFEFCENGAKAVAFELTKRRVTREFFATHSVRVLEQQSDYWLEEQGRLTEPMRYDPATDHYVPIDWSDAFALIAREPMRCVIPTKRNSIRQVEPPTKRRSCTSCLRGGLVRTISRTAQTCAMSRRASDFLRALESAREQWCSTISLTRRQSSSLGKILAPIARV